MEKALVALRRRAAPPAATLAAALLAACAAAPAAVAPPAAPSAASAPAVPAADVLAAELSLLAMAGFAHTDPERTADDVAALLARLEPELELVWGPAVHRPDSPGALDLPRPSDASAFAARDKSGAVWVVFRGTNPVSAAEILEQDARVAVQTPWRELRPGPAPADALVSQSAAAAVALRRDLAPAAGRAGAGLALGDYLVGLAGAPAAPELRFTGHSLGGQLAQTMALWLVDALDPAGDAAPARIDVASFAAPPAGNAAFAAYEASRLPAHRRYVNELDIVPRAWNPESMATLPELYRPDIAMLPLLRAVYDYARDQSRAGGYTQSGEAIAVPARLVPIPTGHYLLEALYQHTVPYRDLLEAEHRRVIMEELIGPLAEVVAKLGIDEAETKAVLAGERPEGR
jgi:hypothetical protein